MPDPEVLESWSPRFHVTAERHWLNDPNGLVQVGGTYHVFFQENPLASSWDRPHWGHVSSRDLVTWRRHEQALSPGTDGPDRDGCWSGCARVVDGVPCLYYTGVVGDDDASRVESVCRATGSADLLRWTRDPAPLVPGPPPGWETGYHRDPFLWRDGDGWHLMLSSGTAGADAHGAVLVHHSPDALDWTYGGVLFAQGSDVPERWECAQLARFPGADVLIVSVARPLSARPLSHVEYFVGHLDGSRFRARRRGRLDGGDALYAPAVMVDEHGRHLLWGWAQETLDVAVQRRLPVAGALTLPRVLSLDGDELRVAPAAELAGLRGTAVPLTPAGTALTASARQLALEAVPSAAVEFVLAAARSGDELRVAVQPGARLEVRSTDPYGTRAHEVAATRAGTLTVHRDGSLVEALYGGEAVTTRWYATALDGWTATTAGCRDAVLWTVDDPVWLPSP
jgi:beta-fructofuranosidase